MSNIPIVVGVTGHRDLRKEDLPALRSAVMAEFTKIKYQCPHSEVWLLSSLAAGADMLCARVALEMGISLICPLPMEQTEYEKDFAAEELDEFRDLIANATECFVVEPIEPVVEGRDFLYRQAGIYVAVHSHVLMALWDGKAGTEYGCGTAEAVDFMLHGNYHDGNAFRAANDGAVIHIKTPRLSGQKPFPISTELLENEPGSLENVIKTTDEFNLDVEKSKSNEDGLLPKEYLVGNVRGRLQSVYSVADGLSGDRQGKYMKTMGAFAVFGVLLVLFYLLYDEAEWKFCLFGYGATVAVYALIYRTITGARQHEKYLQYRALAETLRVQLYFHALGISESVCDDFTWTQKHDSTWIKEAVCALLIGGKEATVPIEAVKFAWLDGQLNYHRNASRRDEKKHRIREKVTRRMIICTVLTWVIVTLLEYGFGDVAFRVVFGLNLRTWLKIIWGCISAVTVFFSGFYGKQSLERKSIDHKKMAALFEQAENEYLVYPTRRMEMFRQLGREELIENGNWVSYCRENRPDFSV